MTDVPDLDAIVAQASRRGLMRGAGLTALAAASAAILDSCSGSKTNAQASTSASAGTSATAGTSSAAGTSSSAAAAGAGAGNFAKTPGFKFTFVNHVTTNPFFQATQYGLQDAAALLGIPTPAWTGSETSDVSQMVNAMNTAITSKVDGIAIALVDQKAFNTPTSKAIAAGIPVVSYNADVATNPRLTYIGQDLFASGQAMGEKIAAAFPDGGSIAIFIATPGSLNIQPRADGAAAALKASGKTFTVKQIATGADINAEQTAIDAFYTGNKDFKGLYAVDGGSTQGVANVMKKYGLAAKGYHGGGFDLLTPTENAIKAGTFDFTIDQSAYLQGFLPTLYLYMYHLSGTLVSPPFTNTGLKFVDKDNVGPYLTTTNRFEGSDKAQKYITLS